MKRAVPWVVAVIAVLAFVASFSELQRMRTRFGEVSRHHFHDHQDVREFMIKAALSGLDHPIVVIGDSIAEMARLPETFDGHRVVNAGIGGATIGDFVSLAPRLLDGITPSIIVIALGANDVGSTISGNNYSALLSRLKRICPTLLAVAVTPMDGADRINTQIRTAARAADVRFVETNVPESERLADRIHLTNDGSRQWSAAIMAALSVPRS